MRSRAILALLSAIVVASAACAKAQARTEPEPPPLDAPAPPPRVLAPLDADPLPQAAVPPAAPRATPPPARPRPATARPDAPATPAAGAAADAPSDRPATDSSGPVLQAAAPVNEAELERRVKQLLSRAATDLNRVDYKRLNAEARSQYDTAKRFIQQAQDAVKERNVVLAEKLADKAAQMAGVLLGR